MSIGLRRWSVALLACVFLPAAARCAESPSETPSTQSISAEDAVELAAEAAKQAAEDAVVAEAAAAAAAGVVDAAESADDPFADETSAGESADAASSGESTDSTGSRPTHKQVRLVSINPDGSSQASVQCFCLGKDDVLLAGCTGSANEIRAFDVEGKLLRKFALPIAPEAINLAADGTILVAGDGKLLRLDAEGKELALVDSPHAESIRQSSDKIREEVVEQHKQQFDMLPQIVASYTQAMEQLDEQIAKIDEQRSEARQAVLDAIVDERIAAAGVGLSPGDSEQSADESVKSAAAKIAQLERRRESLSQTREAYESSLSSYKEQYGDQKEPAELTEEQIDEMVASSMKYKLAVASISGTDDAVFIACRAPVGYSYDVWRMSPELTDGECIVEGLSGCCGQMDVQACASGVYVAENSRHRVCRYDESGELVGKWGKSARRGVEGFGSCCNPMNLAFGADGSVYTAEDTTGRIKRYSAEGQLLSVVGSADVVPGCKKVAIGVSREGDHVFMLDITRNHIAVLERVLPDPEGPISDPEGGAQTVGGAILRALGLSE
jgi:sugar lactone lactonase YvrE